VIIFDSKVPIFEIKPCFILCGGKASIGTQKSADTNLSANAKFMKKEVENDFINRTMQASEKVVGNFGKTLNRMDKVAYDIYKMWSGDGSGGSSRR
jgi:hypothetical protein